MGRRWILAILAVAATAGFAATLASRKYYESGYNVYPFTGRLSGYSTLEGRMFVPRVLIVGRTTPIFIRLRTRSIHNERWLLASTIISPSGVISPQLPDADQLEASPDRYIQFESTINIFASGLVQLAPDVLISPVGLPRNRSTSRPQFTLVDVGDAVERRKGFFDNPIDEICVIASGLGGLASVWLLIVELRRRRGSAEPHKHMSAMAPQVDFSIALPTDSTGHDIAHLDRVLASPSTNRDAPGIAEAFESEPGDDDSYYDTRGSTSFFSRRFSQAFPGVRGVKTFQRNEAVERLSLLLKQPLTFTIDKNSWHSPIWLWGRGSDQIERLDREPNGVVLLNDRELLIDELVAVNAGDYYQKFVYLKVKAMERTGLYSGSNANDPLIGDEVEEYGLFDGHCVTRSEYDDGTAFINGKVVNIEKSVQLRIRHVTPSNFLIAAQNSPIAEQSFDRPCDDILDGILVGTKTLQDLVEAVLKLPKRPPLRHEFS